VKISGVALAAGPSMPVVLEIQGGRITDICAQTDTQVQWIALPPLANMHAHIDRAYTCTSGRPKSLADAISQAADYRRNVSQAQITERARRFVRNSLQYGVSIIRTHTDVDPLIGLRSMAALLAMKRECTDLCKIEIVAFANAANDLADPSACARLEEAMAMGADWAGAAPAFSKEPKKAIENACRIAACYGKGIDLHLDEHLNAQQTLFHSLIPMVLDHGLAAKVAISHGCSLILADADERIEIFGKMQQARATLISLPETNLYLQDRAAGVTPARRGITLVQEALDQGVPVRLGTDNVRDWFYPFGDGDMITTAYVAAIAAQLDNPAQLVGAMCNGHNILRVGDRADFVLLPATSFEQAISVLHTRREVWIAGNKLLLPESPETTLDAVLR
jgi:cytosine/creatinine deaminase